MSKRKNAAPAVMYRQGDVLIRSISSIPKAIGPELQRDKGRVVLAYGEVTGHAHALTDPGVVLFAVSEALKNDEAKRYLRIPKTEQGYSLLRHEEHAEICLPPGDYEVVRQREYQILGPRLVAD